MVFRPLRSLFALSLACLVALPVPAHAAAPSAPQDFRYDVASDLLAWGAPSSNGGSAITAYKLYVSLHPFVPCHPQVQPGPLFCTPTEEALVTAGSCASLGNVLSCQPSDCPVNRKCLYRVSAVNADGESPKTDTATVFGAR